DDGRPTTMDVRRWTFDEGRSTFDDGRSTSEVRRPTTYLYGNPARGAGNPPLTRSPYCICVGIDPLVGLHLNF
ncbi:MAG TPA: hypothetical protein VMN39_12505, partial [Longimicrobiaceae bacterium]|nr:hypothetical protein [Longimicrobiaceae bacterium]